MKFSIVLQKEDYLIYHLYQSTVSITLKKRRLLHWAGVPLVYFVTAFLLRILKSPPVVQAIFLVTGFLWVFLYPFYSKWAIRQFLSRQIAEKYATLLGKEGILQITKNQIELKNEENTMKVSGKDVKGIIELLTHYLIELANGFSLIIPKSQIPEKDLKEGINLISKMSGKEVTNKISWRWR